MVRKGQLIVCYKNPLTMDNLNFPILYFVFVLNEMVLISYFVFKHTSWSEGPDGH